MKVVTDKDLERAKERVLNNLPGLKRDHERLGRLINLLDDACAHATIENVKDYQNKIDDIENSFEFIEVF